MKAFVQLQVDFLPQQDPIAYSQLLQQAETFIRERLLPKLRDLQPEPSVHIVKVRWHLLPGQPLAMVAQCVSVAASEQLVKRSVCAQSTISYSVCCSQTWTQTASETCCASGLKT